jgi:hypothetical protein
MTSSTFSSLEKQTQRRVFRSLGQNPSQCAVANSSSAVTTNFVFRQAAAEATTWAATAGCGGENIDGNELQR